MTLSSAPRRAGSGPKMQSTSAPVVSVFAKNMSTCCKEGIPVSDIDEKGWTTGGAMRETGQRLGRRGRAPHSSS